MVDMWRTQYSQWLTLVLVAFAIVGCSSFESYAEYENPKNGGGLKFEDHDAVVYLYFDREHKFTSVGVVGLPLIPTYIRMSKKDYITLYLNIRIKSHGDFSISRKPCLSYFPSKTICADKVELSAVAMQKDDGTAYSDKLPRWHIIENFKAVGKLKIDLSTNQSPLRITKSDIYEFYFYNGNPDWDRFSVSASFYIPCDTNCPEVFELRFRDYLKIGEKTVTIEDMSWSRNIRYEYHFIIPLQ